MDANLANRVVCNGDCVKGTVGTSFSDDRVARHIIHRMKEGDIANVYVAEGNVFGTSTNRPEFAAGHSAAHGFDGELLPFGM